MKHILSLCVAAGLLCAFQKEEQIRIKEGFYYSTHGHASTLFKIKGNEIEWYRDNVLKAWGRGKFVVNERDSVIKISYEKIWTSSTKTSSSEDFDSSLKTKPSDSKRLLELREYRYTDYSEAIKNLQSRVKKSCKIICKRQ